MRTLDTPLTVKELSQEAGPSAFTLRYYERAGLIPAVGRAGNGHRRYTEMDLRWVSFVSRLRAIGVPVAKIRQYTQLALEGDVTISQRLALIMEYREMVSRQIAELSQNLAVLDDKIEHYFKLLASNAEEAPDCRPPSGPVA